MKHFYWTLLLFCQCATFISCLDKLITTPKAFGHHLKSPSLSFGLVSPYFIQRHQFPPQKYYFAILSSLFWLFLFSSSYYKFVTRSLPFYAYFSYTKKALSLSLSLNFFFILCWIFYILFFLYFYLRLMNVCVF